MCSLWSDPARDGGLCGADCTSDPRRYTLWSDMGIVRVNDQFELEWRPGMTVQDMLDELKFSFRMIVVKVNGELVRRSAYATTAVPDGADVRAIHLISGG